MKALTRTYGMVPELDDLLSMQDEFNRVFSNMGTGTRADGWHPPIDGWVADDNLVIEMEVPGVDPKAVDISVKGDMLTVTGERPVEALGEKATVYRRERNAGKFSRSLELPFGVDSAKVTAHYRNGVLRITLPRAEADKPRKISVEAA